jgi:predicted alpha/beta superfamily hydrolase
VNSRPYDVAITVPDDYDKDSAPLPVVYALDGQIRNAYFPKIVQDSGARIILVQIHDMGTRGIDDVMPGALAFHQFVTKDLRAFIEENYRTDRTRTVVSGLSLSGQFPLLSMYLEMPEKWQFSHYHIVEWGAWPEEAFSTEQRIYDAVKDRSFPVTLIFARGAIQFSPNAKLLHDMFAARKYTDLKLYDWPYPTGHVETDTPALVDLLELLCGSSKCRGLEH